MELMQQKKLTTGFSLTELLITVAIVAILLTIAVPGYQQFIQESRRSDAVISLMRMAASAERYYADQKSFTGATAAGLMGGTASVDGYYTLAMTIDGGGQGYTASATPVAGKSQADDDCYAYLLTSTGLKSNQDSGGTEIPDPSCWPE